MIVCVPIIGGVIVYSNTTMNSLQALIIRDHRAIPIAIAWITGARVNKREIPFVGEGKSER